MTEIFPYLSRGAACFMEMGTGKTKTAIDLAQILYHNDILERVLVIAPLPLLNTWEQELQTHMAYSYGKSLIIGGKQTRINKLQALDHPTYKGKIKWYIINYDGVVTISKELSTMPFDLIICDESTAIKSRTATRTKQIQALFGLTPFKLILTGNPIPKGPEEIFSQYRLIEPATYGDKFFTFRNTFFEIDYFGGIKKFKDNSKEIFEKKFHSKAFVKRKAECLDLPPKIYKSIPITLEGKQRKAYEDMKKDAIASYEDATCSAAVVLTKMLRLSQITGGFLPLDDEKGVVAFEDNPKLDTLMEILEEASDKQVIVWARFQKEIEAIEERLTKAKIPCVTFYGKDTFKERIEARKMFRDKEVRVFIGNPSAGGKGLNDLVGSNICIYYSNSYSAEDRAQSEDRQHRKGQVSDHVLYVDLIAKDTIDESVLAILRSNKNFSDMVLERSLKL